MRCWCRLESCGPPVALWVSPVGNRLRICQVCLDSWFDNADNHPDMEPVAWSWLPGCAPQAVLAA